MNEEAQTTDAVAYLKEYVDKLEKGIDTPGVVVLVRKKGSGAHEMFTHNLPLSEAAMMTVACANIFMDAMQFTNEERPDGVAVH
jgi:hypothetical protein